MLSTTTFPFLPPTTSAASRSMFYCPNLWCRAVVWFYSSCCVSSQRWLYFGGEQSDLYTHLLKFIKTCESHLRKCAINDRCSVRFFGTRVKNSKRCDLVRTSKKMESVHLSRRQYFGGSGVLYLREPLSLFWSVSHQIRSDLIYLACTVGTLAEWDSTKRKEKVKSLLH